ncbi:MAG: signal peptidase I [Deferribacterota bacterium]|nr:signal peptidase I [Deferribacterota bacterium]
MEKQNKNKWRETLDSLVVAFVIAMLIRAFCIQAYKIPSGSMKDTLLPGDHIIVNKMAYKFKKPKFQDILVFEWPLDPTKDFIKRVIGLPGDRIKMEDRILYRNGKKIDEQYVIHGDNFNKAPRDSFDEFTVPNGYYFVMGDNRDSSFDSRYWGLVNKELIKGEAWFIYWSWQLPWDSEDGQFKLRFDRILKSIG